MTLSDHIIAIYNSPVGHVATGSRVTFERGDNFLRIAPLTKGGYSDIVYTAYTMLIVIAPGFFRMQYDKCGVAIYWGVEPLTITQLPGAKQYAATQAAMTEGVLNG